MRPVTADRRKSRRHERTMRLPPCHARHAAVLLSVPPLSDTQQQLCDDWSAAFATQEHEFDAVPLRVTGGSLPHSLRGTLFKNGPARFRRGDERYAHWLDGDGYVTALVLDGSGSATWSGRFVRTEA